MSTATLNADKPQEFWLELEEPIDTGDAEWKSWTAMVFGQDPNASYMIRVIEHSALTKILELVQEHAEKGLIENYGYLTDKFDEVLSR